MDMNNEKKFNLKANEEKTEETICDETPFALFKFKLHKSLVSILL